MILMVIRTTLVVVGDIAVFVAFVFFGKAGHEITIWQSLVRTALPFALVWVACSSCLGSYRTSTLYNLGTMVRNISLIWLLCGLVAVTARAALTEASLILSFAVVSIAIQGLLLITWRGVFMLVFAKLVR